MENADQSLQRARSEIDQLAKSPSTGQEERGYSAADREALVDTINQIFSLFRVNYHNQFYAAFSDSDTLNQAKRMWLNALSHYQAETLLLATRSTIEDSEYLPTLHQFLGRCDQIQFQLPSPRDAYREACLAANNPSSHHWSHAAIYHAGKATGWYALRSQSEKQVFPNFKENFERQVQALREGRRLASPEMPTLEIKPKKPLPAEEQKRRLRQLKSELDF